MATVARRRGSLPSHGPVELTVFACTCGAQATLLSPVRRRRPSRPPRPRAPRPPRRERGAGDHDQPYRYVAPTADRPGPFSLREYARLLVLRGQVLDGRFADDGGPARPSASTPAA